MISDLERDDFDEYLLQNDEDIYNIFPGNVVQRQTQNLKSIFKPPSGLNFTVLNTFSLLQNALNETDAILSTECKGQIASNQHFFINLPFPLSGSREVHTPIFSYDDSRVQSITKVVHSAMETLELDQSTISDLLPRANIIVREYKIGQHISFHVDEQECDSIVVGCILLNENPKRSGLVFRKGEGKYLLNYTMEEFTGTIFLMTNEARYKWLHGLPPAKARRVSITCRFFKSHIINSRLEKTMKLTKEVEQLPQLSENISKVCVTLYRNTDRSQNKPIIVPACVDLKQLQKIGRNKFRMKFQRFFMEDGKELSDGDILSQDDKIFASTGEEFVGIKRPSEKVVEIQISQENSTYGILSGLQKEIDWWNNYHFLKLRFSVDMDLTGSTPCPGKHVNDTEKLGHVIEESYLSVPELRELVYHLQSIVENTENELMWGFRTSISDESRMSAISVISVKNSSWVEFSVSGKPSYKGTKKRDGPLWSFTGGLNNPMEENKKPVSEICDNPKKEFNSEKKIYQTDYRGQSYKKKSQGKNTYQKKRGVEFSENFVFFAGTVWCSSYYTCNIQEDGINYTSATQYVMSEQARLFGDYERRQELLAAGKDPAPHKAFDHKSPKNGQRRLKNFDGALWEKCRERLMWRATYAKFSQNDVLKKRMLQVGNRTFVEATDDPIWGIGISFNHPDVSNPRKWRGPNLMGKILTGICKLICMEEKSADFSVERIEYLLQEETCQDKDIKERLIEFGSHTLYNSGDPDEFKTHGWPGTEWIEKVYNFFRAYPSIVTAQDILREILLYINPTVASQFPYHRHIFQSMSSESQWYRACLYLIEGSLDYRLF